MSKQLNKSKSNEDMKTTDKTDQVERGTTER